MPITVEGRNREIGYTIAPHLTKTDFTKTERAVYDVQYWADITSFHSAPLPPSLPPSRPPSPLPPLSETRRVSSCTVSWSPRLQSHHGHTDRSRRHIQAESWWTHRTGLASVRRLLPLGNGVRRAKSRLPLARMCGPPSKRCRCRFLAAPPEHWCPA